MITTHLILGLFFGVATISAQTLSGRDAAIRPIPPNGRLMVHSHPREEVASLETLVVMSKLIVIGTVGSAMPAVDTSPNPDAPEVETHAAFAVEKVLWGALPKGVNTIYIAQQGGKAGKWDVVPVEDPLLQPGERFILFLAPDDRKMTFSFSSVPRYYTVGAYAGRVAIVNETVQFPSATYARLRGLNGTAVEPFIKAVEDEAYHRIMPPRRNQVPHPGPVAKP